LTSRRDFFKTRRRHTDLNQAEDISPLDSSPLPDPQPTRCCSTSFSKNIGASKIKRKLQRQESKAEQQEARLAKQDAIITQQQKQIEALAAGLEKVSNQVELSKPTRQMAVNNR